MMTFWNDGYLSVVDGEIDERFEQIVQKHLDAFDFDEDEEHEEGTLEFCEYPGDIEDSLKAVVSELFLAGYQVVGSIHYCGDYDGGYRIKSNGTVESYEGYEWALKNMPDKELIEELKSRGYEVRSLYETCFREIFGEP